MYVWNGAELWNAAVLPKKAGESLKIATFTQLKVLVYIATCGQNGVDAAAVAAALGGRITEADCADALAFWTAEGVLVSTDEKAPAPQPKAPPVSPAPAVTPAVPKPLPTAKTLTEADTAAAKKAKKTPSHKEFAELLHTVEARFGKTLSRSDQDRLLDLCEETTLPTEVLLMIVAYTVKNDKKRVSYVQTVAHSWEEKGINTIDAADKYLCHIERCEKAWNKLAEWLTLDIQKPTVSQKELADKWIFEFKQKQPLITLAYDKCLDKTGKFQAAYMDRLLCAWHEDGLSTPEAVAAPKKAAAKKPAKKGEGGFDVEKYEKMVADRTPRFRKKG